MARKDKTLLYVGLAGAAGLGLYMYLKGEYYNRIGSVVAFQSGLPVPSEPGLLELLFSSASQTLAQARMLDDMMKVRGDVHYKAWKAAINANQPTYTVGGTCFKTKDGSLCS